MLKSIYKEKNKLNANSLRYKTLNKILREYENCKSEDLREFIKSRVKSTKEEINQIIKNHPEDIIRA